MINQQRFFVWKTKDRLSNLMGFLFCPQNIWIIILILGPLFSLPVFGENFPSTASSSGFAENKGQFRDQYGNPNPDVLYVADFGGMKVLIRKEGFSYETYEVRPQWVDPATIPYKMLTFTPNGDTVESWPEMEDAKMHGYFKKYVLSRKNNCEIDSRLVFASTEVVDEKAFRHD